MNTPEEYLVDPYQTLDDDDKSRLNTDFSTEDKRFLQSVIPIRGIIQTTVNILLKSVIDEFKSRQITYYDPDNFGILAEIVERKATAGTTGETSERDVGKRTRAVRNPVSKNKNKGGRTKGSPTVRAGGRKAKTGE